MQLIQLSPGVTAKRFADVQLAQQDLETAGWRPCQPNELGDVIRYRHPTKGGYAQILSLMYYGTVVVIER